MCVFLLALNFFKTLTKIKVIKKSIIILRYRRKGIWTFKSPILRGKPNFNRQVHARPPNGQISFARSKKDPVVKLDKSGYTFKLCRIWSAAIMEENFMNVQTNIEEKFPENLRQRFSPKPLLAKHNEQKQYQNIL